MKLRKSYGKIADAEVILHSSVHYFIGKVNAVATGADGIYASGDVLTFSPL
ncbi:hypothetical protein IOK49_02650 [Fervidicoccus fontis]|uniref:Uncharacterized protein n=1 Tax=Fervidicoccus fontis TaxID=683846 RepID=A0A843A6P9_9CREN|nr:hypothetical protein [Fervidicoccus fontis]MBE9390978.1 hypothetical protein [Fervidicoccus fontis]